MIKLGVPTITIYTAFAIKLLYASMSFKPKSLSEIEKTGSDDNLENTAFKRMQQAMSALLVLALGYLAKVIGG